MTTAALSPSGHFASNATNQVSPLASIAVNPGLTPDDFSRMSVHCSGFGGRPVSGPETTCSGVNFASRRLVNQLESGTSPIVLMFFARRPDGLERCTTKRLYERSYNKPIFQG